MNKLKTTEGNDCEKKQLNKYLRVGLACWPIFITPVCAFFIGNMFVPAKKRSEKILTEIESIKNNQEKYENNIPELFETNWYQLSKTAYFRIYYNTEEDEIYVDFGEEKQGKIRITEQVTMAKLEIALKEMISLDEKYRQIMYTIWSIAGIFFTLVESPWKMLDNSAQEKKEEEQIRRRIQIEEIQN